MLPLTASFYRKLPGNCALCFWCPCFFSYTPWRRACSLYYHHYFKGVRCWEDSYKFRINSSSYLNSPYRVDWASASASQTLCCTIDDVIIGVRAIDDTITCLWWRLHATTMYAASNRGKTNLLTWYRVIFSEPFSHFMGFCAIIVCKTTIGPNRHFARWGTGFRLVKYQKARILVKKSTKKPSLS